MDHVRRNAEGAHHAYTKDVNHGSADRGVTADIAQYRYSITVETQDDAVLFCLRALWQYAERHPLHAERRGDRDDRRMRGSGDGRITFRFSNPYNRGDFLGEATRLLAGKWTRIAESDNDALPS